MDTMRHMEPAEFVAQARKVGTGLAKAIRETPQRLRRLYSQPNAITGATGFRGVEQTAGQAAGGLRRLVEQMREFGRDQKKP